MRIKPACEPVLPTAMRTFVLALAIACSVPAYAQTLTGVPYVIDADTISIGTDRIRLQGIDAPETDQICLDDHGKPWSCGIEARDRLIQHLGSRAVTCVTNGKDVYHRWLAVCSTDEGDLGTWLVREGFALAFVRYSHAYVADEAVARGGRKGLWEGSFVAPWDWRHRTAGTAILGAYRPTEQQANLLLSGPQAQACVIKGNINSAGERIYHMPGQRYYAATQINESKGERWFCSEEAAVAAGWRRAKV